MRLAFLDDLREIESILYIGVFIGVLLVFAGIQEWIGSRSIDEGERNRRMRMIRKGIDDEQIFATLIGDTQDIGATAQGPIALLKRNLRRAGLPISVPAVFAIALVLSALLTYGFSLKVPLSAAALLGVGLGTFLTIAAIDGFAKERVKKLTAQLPEALDMMSRGLKIGHPLNVTLKRVAQQMPDPIGTEFGLIEDSIRHGADVSTAISDFAARFETEDTRYFAACVAIQHGTGGNLGRVLTVLSRVIRDRINMRLKIKAVSGEGRISAFILSIMPFLIIGSIYTSTPTYYTDVMDHPAFMPAAWAALGMVVLQALILRRLATFDF
ncbi:MAG: type II secretion system F family protein [Maritimibacter sp.]|nr:type II secretion system F family protein [Maritimibacter sp.]